MHAHTHTHTHTALTLLNHDECLRQLAGEDGLRKLSEVELDKVSYLIASEVPIISEIRVCLSEELQAINLGLGGSPSEQPIGV